MKKLSSTGISHLLVPLLVFVMLGAIGGTYLLTKSHAATTTTTADTTTTTTTTAETNTIAEPTYSGTDASDTDTAALTANVKALVAEAPSSGPYHLCLWSAHSYCQVSHGPGNQNTISNSTRTNWYYTAGSTTVQWHNGTGYCLRANSTNTVTVESHGCQGDDGEKWIVTRQDPFRFKSYKFRSNNWFMGAYGPHNNYKVWAQLYGTRNFWISWGMFIN